MWKTSTKEEEEEEGVPLGTKQQQRAAGQRDTEVAAEGVVVVGGVQRSLHLLAVLSDGRSILHAFVPTEEVLRHRPAQSERAQQQGLLCTTTGPALANGMPNLAQPRCAPRYGTSDAPRLPGRSPATVAGIEPVSSRRALRPEPCYSKGEGPLIAMGSPMVPLTAASRFYL